MSTQPSNRFTGERLPSRPKDFFAGAVILAVATAVIGAAVYSASPELGLIVIYIGATISTTCWLIGTIAKGVQVGMRGEDE